MENEDGELLFSENYGKGLKPGFISFLGMEIKFYDKDSEKFKSYIQDTRNVI